MWHNVNSLPILYQGTVICHGVITDVTSRVIARQRSSKPIVYTLLLVHMNQMIVRTANQENLFYEACTIYSRTKASSEWHGLVCMMSSNSYYNPFIIG
jgi:hypothetical protein